MSVLIGGSLAYDTIMGEARRLASTARGRAERRRPEGPQAGFPASAGGASTENTL